MQRPSKATEDGCGKTLPNTISDKLIVISGCKKSCVLGVQNLHGRHQYPTLQDPSPHHDSTIYARGTQISLRHFHQPRPSKPVKIVTGQRRSHLAASAPIERNVGDKSDVRTSKMQFLLWRLNPTSTRHGSSYKELRIRRPNVLKMRMRSVLILRLGRRSRNIIAKI